MDFIVSRLKYAAPNDLKYEENSKMPQLGLQYAQKPGVLDLLDRRRSSVCSAVTHIQTVRALLRVFRASMKIDDVELPG